MIRLALLSLVLLFVVAGCGGGEASPVARVTATEDAAELQPTGEGAGRASRTPSGASDEEPAPTATSEVQSGVRGVVLAYSDVGSQPDEPLAEQTVVILPLQAADELLGSPASPAPDELRFLQTTVPEADRRITLAVTDAAGRYEAGLPPGEYVLCLADAAGPTPTDYPLAVRGCGAFVVPPGAVAEVNVSSGFGEILLEVG